MGSVRVEFSRFDFAGGVPAETTITLDCWKARILFISQAGDFSGLFINGVALGLSGGIVISSFMMDYRFGGLVMGQDVRPVNLSQLLRIRGNTGANVAVWIEREYYDPLRQNLQS